MFNPYVIRTLTILTLLFFIGRAIRALIDFLTPNHLIFRNKREEYLQFMRMEPETYVIYRMLNLMMLVCYLFAISVLLNTF